MMRVLFIALCALYCKCDDDDASDSADDSPAPPEEPDMGGYNPYGYGGYGGGGGGAPDEGSPSAKKRGILELDDLTFDKIVDGTKTVFVEFYAPWCSNCMDFVPGYEEIAKDNGDNPNILVAKIDAEEYKDISEKYGVKDNYPQFRYFKKGTTEAASYDGDKDKDGVSEFINWLAGVGRVEALSPFVSRIIKESDKEAVRAEAQKVVDGLEDEQDQHDAKFYMLVMKKIIEKGDKFCITEFDRLTRVTENPKSLTKEKYRMFRTRINVLSLFKDVLEPSSKKDEV